MEPTYMLLGQAAATAAALALDSRTSVQDVDYNRLRTRLLSDGQVLSTTVGFFPRQESMPRLSKNLGSEACD